MDFTPLFTLLLTNFWFIIPLAILVAILKSNWFKGIVGEFIINLQAKFFLNKDEYHLIKNVTLPTTDGTTKIDHYKSIYNRFRESCNKFRFEQNQFIPKSTHKIVEKTEKITSKNYH